MYLMASVNVTQKYTRDSHLDKILMNQPSFFQLRSKRFYYLFIILGPQLFIHTTDKIHVAFFFNFCFVAVIVGVPPAATLRFLMHSQFIGGLSVKGIPRILVHWIDPWANILFLGNIQKTARTNYVHIRLLSACFFSENPQCLRMQFARITLRKQ